MKDQSNKMMGARRDEGGAQNNSEGRLEARLEKRITEAVKNVNTIKDRPMTNRVLVECTARLVEALCRNDEHSPCRDVISEEIWNEVFDHIHYDFRPDSVEEEIDSQLQRELRLYR
jgi:hypothetical protein